MLLMNKGMVSCGDLLRTRIRPSASSWTDCGSTWWRWMHRYLMSYRCSVGFRSREWEGQSMASIPSSSGNCLHTLATWGQALSCIRKNPELNIAEMWDSLVWNMHTSSLLEVILWGSVHAPKFPPSSKSKHQTCCWVDALLRHCPALLV